MNIGSKIKYFRKQRNMSQEALAQSLGVSFQTISKWENGITMPDISMICAIAYFFGITTDELFEFNRYEIEKKVDEICKDAVVYRNSNPKRAEEILKEGLKKYPGNDILLNNLLYTMRSRERNHEVVELCKMLIEMTKLDDVKYDATRILAETYHSMNEYELTKETIAQIPEIYFTKLQLDALLLSGEEQYEAAKLQKYYSVNMLVQMLRQLAQNYYVQGESEKGKKQLVIASQIVSAFEQDDMLYDGCGIYDLLKKEYSL